MLKPTWVQNPARHRMTRVEGLFTSFLLDGSRDVLVDFLDHRDVYAFLVSASGLRLLS